MLQMETMQVMRANQKPEQSRFLVTATRRIPPSSQELHDVYTQLVETYNTPKMIIR
jgi:hypothetical protein